MTADFNFNQRFRFPLELNDGEIPGHNDKICIISIFGKSRLSPFTCKASCLNSVLDKDVFQGVEGFLKEQVNNGQIECFYDADSHILYLHLLSFNDLNHLARECQRLTQDGNIQDFYGKWQSEDFIQAKNLAFLFAVSHIILLYHPGSSFDLTYLRLFHNLDSMRLKLESRICDLLSSIPGVSKDWSSFGRVCTPRMLFLFETSTVDFQPEESEGMSSKPTKKYSPIRKLQIAMEDTIFLLLRKTRAITNVTNKSLFSVPTNQPYVYVLAKKSEICDPVDFLLTQMKMKCFPAKEESPLCGVTATSQIQNKPRPYSASRRCRPNPAVPEVLSLSTPSLKSSVLRNVLNSSSSSSVNQQKQSSFSSTSSNTSYPKSSSSQSLHSSMPFTSLSMIGQRSQEQCLKEFLWQHVDMVFSKSVNDNMGRHGIEPVFELPNLGTWLRSARSLYDFFFPGEALDPAVNQSFSNLRNSLDISMRFSESRCQKWMSSAESTYQQDLPPFYVSSYHQSRLAKAKRVFSQYARGPAYSKYLYELEKWCEAYWKAGHQQCEAVSLSGNLCTLQWHHLPTDHIKLPDDGFLITDHCSGLKTRSACNCGRKQADKDDPFCHKYANHTFYQMLEVSCCGSLEHLTLPVFIPTTPDPCAVVQPAVSTHEDQPHQQLQDNHEANETQKAEAFSTLSELSWTLSLDQTSTITVDPAGKLSSPSKLSEVLHSPVEQADPPAGDVEANATVDSIVVKTENLTLDDEDNQGTQRQISTTEYLSSMIHTKSPPGLLPKFSSFSLCCLGPAGLYSHNIGLDLPGFFPGSSFLLPWDISVKHEPRDKWPSVAETFSGSKKRQQRKQSKVTMESSETQITIRVYLGIEYECPRGHRFFCSGPDKIIKVSANSAVKDNAGRLVHMDMPLYTLCHCKQPKGCMAQMMRVFVVTPRDSPNCPSIRVQANPIIQPSPPPCPQFHPGLESALELPPDGIWVLRLPHVYQDDECVYLMPSDPQALHNCYLIKGTFSHRVV